MSNDQGDQTLKDNEDILTDSPDTGEKENLSQIESSDLVDHSVSPKPKYDQIEPLKEGLDVISAKSNTDSGFKDPGAGPTDKTDFDTSSDDEDLHLKWEDDETEEQAEPVPKEVDKNVSKALDEDEGVADEVLDENLLLESSEEADKMDVSVNPEGKTEDLQEPETSVVDIDKLLKSDDDDITDESKTTKSEPEFNTNILEMTPDSSDKTTAKETNVKSNENEGSIDKGTLNTAPVEEIKENIAGKETTDMPITDTNNKDESAIEETNVKSIEKEDSIDHEIRNTAPVEEIKEIIAGNVSGKETTDMPITDTHNKDESVTNDSIIATSSPNESISNTTIDAISDHRLNKPDAMLEIPTQEVIDILDDTDISIANADNTEMENSLKSQQTEDAKVDTIDVTDKTIETVQLQSKEEQTIELDSAVFEVDLKEQVTVQTSTVSEDDWSEIERKLKGFETSLVEDSGSKVEVETSAEDSESKIDSTKAESNKSPNAEILESKELENSREDDSKTDTNQQPNESSEVRELGEVPKPASPIHKPKLKLRDIGSLLAKPITTSAEIINIDESSLTEFPETLYKSIDLISEDSNDKTISDKLDSISLIKAQSSEEMLIESMTDVNILPDIDSHPTEDLNMDVDDEPSNSEVDVEKTASLFDTVIKIDDSTKSISKMDVDAENIEPTIQSSSQQLENLTISKDDEVPTNVTNDPLTLEGTPTIIEVQPSPSIKVISKSSTSEADEVQPSTSGLQTDEQPSTSGLQTEVQPSTSVEVSQLVSDSSDDVPEVTDSLGLLAESSRVMEDDEEQEDDDDDDDDFYPEDESSNQMTAEHSEDSNAQQSETDMKEQEGKETDTESPLVEKEQFSFDVGETTVTEKDGTLKEKDGEIDEDEVVCEDDVVTETIADETATNEAVVAESNKGTKPDDEVKSDQSKQEIETVKLSDTSDTEQDVPAVKTVPRQDTSKTEKGEAVKSSPAKKLEYSKPGKVLNYVDLEESSEDEIQEVKKDGPTPEADKSTTITVEKGNVVIPSEVEVKASGPEEKQSDSTAQKEVTVETPSTTETPQDENKASEDTSKAKHKFSLEVFSLDSDEEDTAPQPPKELTGVEIDKARENNKCINLSCTSTTTVYYTADPSTVSYYDAERKRKAMVCEECAEVVARRAKSLVDGIRELTPLLSLEPARAASELVEISDSDSDADADDSRPALDAIGHSGAQFIEKELAKTLNETWVKYNLDSRLTEAQEELQKEMKKLEEETKEIDALLSECQVATDQLRNELYATFEQERLELNALSIHDTPGNKFMCLESAVQSAKDSLPTPETRAKRRLSSASEIAPKRAAIPLGYTPLDGDKSASQEFKSEPTVETTKADDDKDIAVLKVSAEAAPSDLPPPGEVIRPPLKADMQVYAMRNTFGSWAKAKVLEVQGKQQVPGASQSFTICRVKLFSRSTTKTKQLPARGLAYSSPAPVRMTIGTRVIALFKDPMNDLRRETFYSGIIAEVPNPVNSYRYLVFFDDGYAQYVRHRDTRLVCECSPLVWEEVHPFSREFVRKYLIAYPERPMVRLHAGQSLKTEWNGKWWTSRVISVDASLVQVHFEEDNRTEWIYRGSTRLAPLYLELQAAERHRARPMPRTKAQPRVNMPYVEYTRSDEQSKPDQQAMPPRTIAAQEREREIRQRAVAKKSTAAPQQPPATHTESVTSRVVYYTPKNAVKPYKMTPHTCGPHCKRNDTLALKDLRTYNPLAKPLLSGWERQIVRYNGHKEVMYRAPCGRRLRCMRELHRYLRTVQSDLPVDLFDFTPHTHCLAEFVLNKCLVGKKDLSHGKENVPVPCVNYYDESLPEFCSYNTERTPTAGVPLNIDPEFLCGCDCTDDCEDKTKCACWKMTLEGARTIGLDWRKVGYVYKRLPEPLPSGIYECNSRCKCKQTCLNRVAQHPLQLKLQVFKTLNRGWGIRALNDVPKGSFLCVYAGNLLTDATANMDGLNEGDEYLAELDYIEVVEQMKEGYEEDIPEKDKKLDKVQKRDKKQKHNETPEEPEMSSSDEEEPVSKNEQEDGDFCPGFIGMGVTEFSKRLRKRDKGKKEKEEPAVKEKEEKPDEDCITISDDEEVREPASFMAQAGMESSEFVSKYKSVRSLFGKDEACYIVDAKVQGNIGRYLNHSCMPNVFVQNVFVDTHDPRFPWVAFFALSHIKAGTELTWNYNYDVGSVPGKTLYCYCGAPNCRGRLL